MITIPAYFEMAKCGHLGTLILRDGKMRVEIFSKQAGTLVINLLKNNNLIDDAEAKILKSQVENSSLPTLVQFQDIGPDGGVSDQLKQYLLPAENADGTVTIQ